MYVKDIPKMTLYSGGSLHLCRETKYPEYDIRNRFQAIIERAIK